MRTWPLHMRRITLPMSVGSKTITVLEFPTIICLFNVQLLLGYDDARGSLTLECLSAKSLTA